MMTYNEAVDYLFNAAPLFQNIGAGAYKEGLYNSMELDKHFGYPHRQFKTIHIAGTNGKGSCSHTLAAILQEAGYKVGLYTSPHLIDFRERIRVNGVMIDEESVISFVENERSFFEPLHPSFFELTTALAFKYFAEQQVDVALIEVGLGGRLDCTNIITPDLSVITNISFDHVQFLGDTLSKIASEKAGIIKQNVPVVVGETTNETKIVFENKAHEMKSLIRFAEEEHEIISLERTNGEVVYQTQTFGSIKATLTGACQIKNTATILTAVKELQNSGYHINTEHVKSGFQNVCRLTGLQGRWQKMSTKPDVICDTGHNLAGIEYIVKQLNEYEAENIRIVIGMVNDKDVTGVLSILPRNAIYYFTKASVQRAMNENDFYEKATVAGLRGKKYPDVRSAFEAATAEASEKDLIFVGGSTFIVADFLSFFKA